MNHISFPSIDQFNHAIKHVTQNAKYHEQPVPTVRFEGTVKLHGTNFAVVNQPLTGETWYQSRERIITPEQDNAGSAALALRNKSVIDAIFANVKANEVVNENDTIQIFGEICGGNIQKGVGLVHVPKMFVIFGIRISENAESQVWMPRDKVEKYVGSVIADAPEVFHIWQFPTYTMDIDFSEPRMSQNELVAITDAVEKDCPVSRKLLGDAFASELIGEGVVWTAIDTMGSSLNLNGIRFKVKGPKHASSKVKTTASVDVEKVKSIAEFVDKTVTENRLN